MTDSDDDDLATIRRGVCMAALDRPYEPPVRLVPPRAYAECQRLRADPANDKYSDDFLCDCAMVGSTPEEFMADIDRWAREAWDDD